MARHFHFLSHAKMGFKPERCVSAIYQVKKHAKYRSNQQAKRS